MGACVVSVLLSADHILPQLKFFEKIVQDAGDLHGLWDLERFFSISF